MKSEPSEVSVDDALAAPKSTVASDLDLLRPIYAKTAAYGHFGRELPEFTWERTDRADELKAAAGI